MHGLPAEVFYQASAFMPADFAWDSIAPWGDLAPIAGMIVGRAPLIFVPPYAFRLDPAMEAAHRSFWHFVVAIRTGTVPRREDSFPAFYGSQDAETDAYLRRVQALVRDRWDGELPPALFGRRIIDCVAPDFVAGATTPVCLAGVADAVGQAPAWGEAPRPVRVHKSVHAWLAARCEGIVPLGAEAKQQATLLRCRGGVVAADLRHGRALQRLMCKPLLPVPEVFVQA